MVQPISKEALLAILSDPHGTSVSIMVEQPVKPTNKCNEGTDVSPGKKQSRWALASVGISIELAIFLERDGLTGRLST